MGEKQAERPARRIVYKLDLARAFPVELLDWKPIVEFDREWQNEMLKALLGPHRPIFFN